MVDVNVDAFFTRSCLHQVRMLTNESNIEACDFLHYTCVFDRDPNSA